MRLRPLPPTEEALAARTWSACRRQVSCPPKYEEYYDPMICAHYRPRGTAEEVWQQIEREREQSQ